MMMTSRKMSVVFMGLAGRSMSANAIRPAVARQADRISLGRWSRCDPSTSGSPAGPLGLEAQPVARGSRSPVLERRARVDVEQAHLAQVRPADLADDRLDLARRSSRLRTTNARSRSTAGQALERPDPLALGPEREQGGQRQLRDDDPLGADLARTRAARDAPRRRDRAPPRCRRPRSRRSPRSARDGRRPRGPSSGGTRRRAPARRATSHSRMPLSVGDVDMARRTVPPRAARRRPRAGSPTTSVSAGAPSVPAWSVPISKTRTSGRRWRSLSTSTRSMPGQERAAQLRVVGRHRVGGPDRGRVVGARCPGARGPRARRGRGSRPR